MREQWATLPVCGTATSTIALSSTKETPEAKVAGRLLLLRSARASQLCTLWGESESHKDVDHKLCPT